MKTNYKLAMKIAKDLGVFSPTEEEIDIIVSTLTQAKQEHETIENLEKCVGVSAETLNDILNSKTMLVPTIYSLEGKVIEFGEYEIVGIRENKIYYELNRYITLSEQLSDFGKRWFLSKQEADKHINNEIFVKVKEV